MYQKIEWSTLPIKYPKNKKETIKSFCDSLNTTVSQMGRHLFDCVLEMDKREVQEILTRFLEKR